jgi:hypothetical protein
MKANLNEPAFATHADGLTILGLSKREYAVIQIGAAVAGKALEQFGCLVIDRLKSDLKISDGEAIAKIAIETADAIFAELEKERESK